MRKVLLILAAIASATLVGCTVSIRPAYVPGFSNPFLTTATCNVQDCPPLTVTVNDCATGNITVADILDMTAGPPGVQRSVTWTISNDGYEFSKEAFKYGIFIKLDGGDEFKNVQITNQGKTLSIKYDKSGTATRGYSYALTVRHSDGDKSVCKTLDPWMIT